MCQLAAPDPVEDMHVGVGERMPIDEQGRLGALLAYGAEALVTVMQIGAVLDFG